MGKSRIANVPSASSAKTLGGNVNKGVPIIEGRKSAPNKSAIVKTGGKSNKGPVTKGVKGSKAAAEKTDQQQGGRGRNKSAQSGKAVVNVKPSSAANSAIPVSVASRYNKPGGGRGFGPGAQVDLLTPTVPPLYPTAPKPSPLNLEVKIRVTIYKRCCQYLTSNYGVHLPRRAKCGFNVDRYTDRYKAPLTVNPDIVHRISSQRLPEELTSTKIQLRKPQKSRIAIKKRIPVIDELPDDEEQKDESGQPIEKKSNDEESAAPLNELLDDEEMEEADEELDQGTDYLTSHFDNGEDMDGDADADDEGLTY